MIVTDGFKIVQLFTMMQVMMEVGFTDVLVSLKTVSSGTITPEVREINFTHRQSQPTAAFRIGPAGAWGISPAIRCLRMSPQQIPIIGISI